MHGLKPQDVKTETSESGGSKLVVPKLKLKLYPRDLKEIRRRVQEHRYKDIVSSSV